MYMADKPMMTQDTMKKDPPKDDKVTPKTDDKKFCPYCGNELEKEQDAASNKKK